MTSHNHTRLCLKQNHVCATILCNLLSSVSSAPVTQQPMAASGSSLMGSGMIAYNATVLSQLVISCKGVNRPHISLIDDNQALIRSVTTISPSWIGCIV